jgi:hypothetical protein
MRHYWGTDTAQPVHGNLAQSCPQQHQRRIADDDIRRRQAEVAERGTPFRRSPDPRSDADALLTGGCLCGAVRYTLDVWPKAAHCHCRACRRISGAAFSTWASVPARAFHILSGRISVIRSSDRAERGSCTCCGSLLTMVYDTGTEVSVTVGSLDDPDGLRASESLWTSERLCWTAAIDAGLPVWPGDAPGDG